MAILARSAITTTAAGHTVKAQTRGTVQSRCLQETQRRPATSTLTTSLVQTGIAFLSLLGQTALHLWTGTHWWDSGQPGNTTFIG